MIREMMLREKKIYSEFLEIDEAIATNVLADRLKHLEPEGIISKLRDPDNRRAIYSLTAKAHDLAPVIVDINIWRGKYDQRSFARRAILKTINKDRKDFEAQLRSQ